jgi:chromosome partitioning protein
MGKIYAVAMNKGGVGKTSLVTNLAGVLSEKYPDKKILLIDTDGQGNSCMSFGKNPKLIEENVYDLFVGDAGVDDVKISVSENIDLVPATRDMNFVEYDILTQLNKYPKPFEVLKKQVDEIIDDYDYILLDTPPSIGLVTLNVLKIADEVIIPFMPESYSVSGLSSVIEAINDFKDKENTKLKISGVVGMMIQPVNLHTFLTEEVSVWCKKNGVNFYDTHISRSIRFAEATADSGVPAVWYDKNHKMVKQYFDLAQEVFEYGKRTAKV